MAIEDDIRFFESVPSLRILGRSALRVLAIGAESRYVHGGEVLFEKGENADAGYLIQEGAFRLDGQERGERSAIVHAGTLLSEFAMVTKTVHAFTATAIEPSTVLRISRPVFVKMLEGHPEAARRLREHVAKQAEDSARDLQRVRDAFARHDPR
jgi:CRP-like cAMP-binding protein